MGFLVYSLRAEEPQPGLTIAPACRASHRRRSPTLSRPTVLSKDRAPRTERLVLGDAADVRRPHRGYSAVNHSSSVIGSPTVADTGRRGGDSWIRLSPRGVQEGQEVTTTAWIPERDRQAARCPGARTPYGGPGREEGRPCLRRPGRDADPRRRHPMGARGAARLGAGQDRWIWASRLSWRLPARSPC
jgi:hypothetical protein